MKKIFVLFTIIAAFGLMGCPTDDGDNNGYDPTTDPDYTSDPLFKINNLTAIELTEVKWGMYTFASLLEGGQKVSILPGSSAAEHVSPGQGYIFFTRKPYPFAFRTQEMIFIEGSDTVEFTFTNNTVIVDVNNPSNVRTLGSLQNIVVWFDDALPPHPSYYEQRGRVMYYSNDDISAGYLYANYVKNGNTSIGIGNGSPTNPAQLHLKVNLTRNAKLSFWYTNQANGTEGTTFSINGEVKRTWTSDVLWSSIEFDLPAGENDLIWEKKDSYDFYSGWLSLDDILIYYTD
ncbi:hypothetical protein AGMMS49991_02800 [Spirochaetia bacterium]|nr:hypothetical protein AGMMS49991_02800 [Spirochaetia bacterium]